MERAERGRAAMAADERKAFDAAVAAIERLPHFICERRQALEALEGMASAKGRTDDRRRSDKQTDRQRRKLIGAKLRIEDAAEVEMRARMKGVSTYRFVVDALMTACGREEQRRAMPCPVVAIAVPTERQPN